MAQAQRLNTVNQATTSAGRISKPTKTRFVNELTASSVVDSLFVLAYKDSRISSNAGRYLTVELQDRTGSIRGFQFDRSSFADIPPVGSVVQVKGHIKKRNEKMRIKISEIREASHYSPADFVAQSLRPVFEMREEFSRILLSVQRKAYVQLAKKIVGTKEVFESFLEAPARDRGAGACRGGALEQSLKLARIVDALCGVYPQANRDELMIAALTYLVGTVDAFDFDTSIKKTKVGKRLDPIYLSGLKLQRLQAHTNATGSEAVLGLHELFMVALRQSEGGADQAFLEEARIELVIFYQALQVLSRCEEADSRETAKRQAGYE